MKMKLTEKEMVTFFSVITHCDTKHMLTEKILKEYTEVTCAECNEPIAFRGDNGYWYTLGNRIFP